MNLFFHWHWFPLTLLCAVILATSDTLVKKLLQAYVATERVVVHFLGAGVLPVAGAWRRRCGC